MTYVSPRDLTALLPRSLLLNRLESAHHRHLDVAESRSEATMSGALRFGGEVVLGKLVERFLTVVGDGDLEAGTLELTKKDFLVDEVVLRKKTSQYRSGKGKQEKYAPRRQECERVLRDRPERG